MVSEPRRVRVPRWREGWPCRRPTLKRPSGYILAGSALLRRWSWREVEWAGLVRNKAIDSDVDLGVDEETWVTGCKPCSNLGENVPW